jgi:hypothetical protein
MEQFRLHDNNHNRQVRNECSEMGAVLNRQMN